MAWEPDENVKVLDSDQDELMLKKLEKIAQLANQAMNMVQAKKIESVAQYKSVQIGTVDKGVVEKHMQSAVNDLLNDIQAELQKLIDMSK